MFERFKKNKTKPGARSVLIIEDDVLYGKALRTFIKIHFPRLKEVSVFTSGEKAMKGLDKDPGVVIIDYFLNSKYPDAANGLQIIKHIRSHRSNTTIIVLSSQNSPGVIMEAIRDYKCKYVNKDKDAFHHVEWLLKESLAQNNLQPTIHN